MSIPFINGSPHKNGRTAQLAATLLHGREYDTLHLADYKIYEYDQRFDDDQFDQAIDRMRAAGTIVMGSPCYWHNMSGLLRCFLDRHYQAVGPETLAGKKLAFVFQGEGPEPWMVDTVEYTIKRYVALGRMTYVGMATNADEARKLAAML